MKIKCNICGCTAGGVMPFKLGHICEDCICYVKSRVL